MKSLLTKYLLTSLISAFILITSFILIFTSLFDKDIGMALHVFTLSSEVKVEYNDLTVELITGDYLENPDEVSETYEHVKEDISELIECVKSILKEDIVQVDNLIDELDTVTGASISLQNVKNNVGALNDAIHEMSRLTLDYAFKDLTRSLITYIGAIIILYVALSLYVVISRVIIPIRTLKNSIDDTDGLKIDNKLLNKKDEIGLLARSINNAANKNNKLMESINKTIMSVDSVVQQLTASSQESYSINEEMYSNATSLSNTCLDYKKMSEDAMLDIQNLNAVMSKGVESVSSVTSISKDIGTNMLVGIDNNRDLVESLSKSDGYVLSLAHSVNENVKSVNRIRDILADVHRISQMTKTLSINARIQAHNSDGNSKGFEAVAQEIGKLAVQSEVNATNITRISEELLDAILNVQENLNTYLSSSEVISSIIKKGTLIYEEADSDIVTLSKEVDNLGEVTGKIVKHNELTYNSFSEVSDGMVKISKESNNIEECLKSSSELSMNIAEISSELLGIITELRDMTAD